MAASPRTALADAVRYGGFGDVLTESNPAAGDRYKYTGREADAGGTLFLRDRVLDLSSGRFLARDRMGFAAGDANLTRYVGNGFTNATDPSGFYDVPGMIASLKEKSPEHRDLLKYMLDQGGWALERIPSCK